MSDVLTTDNLRQLGTMLKGDLHAFRFCNNLLYIAHLWDDLHDRDKDRTVAEVDAAFRILLVDNGQNPFYVNFYSQLYPLMASAAMLWMDSNVLAKEDKFKAIMIRNKVLDIIHYSIFLVGGPEWVTEQGPEFWRVFGIPFAKYEEFLSED
jgi:hypothetical protein